MPNEYNYSLDRARENYNVTLCTGCTQPFMGVTIAPVTPFTLHEAMRAYLEKIVKSYGRDAVAKALGCSKQNVDYLCKGYVTVKKKTMPRFVDFQQVEALARAKMLINIDLLDGRPILTAALIDVIGFVGLAEAASLTAEISALPRAEKAHRRP